MTPQTPSRRALIAYAAGMAVIASLMTVVLLSGGAVTARKSPLDLSSSHLAAQRQP
jgi:hypothetical protein